MKKHLLWLIGRHWRLYIYHYWIFTWFKDTDSEQAVDDAKHISMMAFKNITPVDGHSEFEQSDRYKKHVKLFWK